MTVSDKILEVIEKIKKHCIEIDNLSNSISLEFENEKRMIEQNAKKIIEDMGNRFSEFKRTHFDSIKNKANTLAALLENDYRAEWNKLPGLFSEFNGLSFKENEEKLHELVTQLNEYIEELNSINFDSLVPPVKIEIDERNEVFKTIYTWVGILLVIFLSSLKTVDYGRLYSQWNREYLVSRFGVYFYQIKENLIVHKLQIEVFLMFL